MKDINAAAGAGSSVELMTAVSGTVYFRADNGTSGVELWRTDGTASGTWLVKDINAGAGASSPTSFVSLGPNGPVLFSASDFSYGSELWKTNGTATGTVFVKDINTNNYSPYPSMYYLVLLNGVVLFQGSSTDRGTELWRTDGTAEGTYRLKDIWPGSGYASPSYLTVSGNYVYFYANDGVHGIELWRTDGTLTGTIMLSDTPYVNSSMAPVDLNGVVYFSAQDATGLALFRSDGTPGGTRPVKYLNPFNITNVNGTLFFGATSLWKSDGTEAGTVQVKYISDYTPQRLTAVGSTLFFVVDDGIGHGSELWKSDGTAAGTVMVKDIKTGAFAYSDPNNLTNVNGMLVFTADDGTHGRELWVSDGTEAGTQMLADIYPGATGSSITTIINDRGLLLFNANDGTHGLELWGWQLDVSAPAVSSIPSTGSRRPSWTWVSGGGGGIGTFRYQLDGELPGSWFETTATSFTPAQDLLAGSRTLYVQERTQSGTWSASASSTTLVDTALPCPPVVSGSSVTTDTTPAWTWTSAGCGGNRTYRYQFNSTAGVWTETTATSYTHGSVLGNGTYYLAVQERNAGGVWSDTMLTPVAQGAFFTRVDTIAPNPPVVAGPSLTNSSTPTWTWSSGGPDGSGTFRYTELESPYTVVTTTQRSYTPRWGLYPGDPSTSYTLLVEERDSAGNWSAAGTWTVTIDMTQPDLTVDLTPEAVTRNTNAVFQFSTTDPTAAISCQLDYTAAGFTSCSSAHVIDMLGTGTHIMAIRATDPAGNYTEWKYEWTIMPETLASAYMWGRNNMGQLATGVSDTQRHATPAAIPGQLGFSVITGGNDHALALKSDGTVWTWGGNAYGQLGSGSYDSNTHPAPIQVALPANAVVTAVSAGPDHNMAIVYSGGTGTIYSWGSNGTGPSPGDNRLGTGGDVCSNPDNIWNSGDEVYCNPTPHGLEYSPYVVPFPVAVAAGGNFSAAISNNGTDPSTVYVWGRNDSGQKGNGSTPDGFNFPPTVANGINDVKSICAGDRHILALRNDGSVWSWGSNDSGQLGYGTGNNYSSSPSQIWSLSSIKQIACGARFSLAVTTGGMVYSWGSNSKGQLGRGTVGQNDNSPMQVNGLQNIDSIAASYDHALAVDRLQDTYTWGGNIYGQLGTGTYDLSAHLTPAKAIYLSGAVKPGAGKYFSSAVASYWTRDTIQVISENTGTTSRVSIAVDGQGKVHAAVTSPNTAGYPGQDTFYYKNTSGSWDQVSVGGNSACSSIALDGSGTAYVLTMDQSGMIQITWYGQYSPNSTTITYGADTSVCPSLAIDAAGAFHVVYEYQEQWWPYSRRLVHKAGASVYDLQSGSAENIGYDPIQPAEFAVTTDSSLNVHLAYKDNSGNIWYLKRDSMGWSGCGTGSPVQRRLAGQHRDCGRSVRLRPHQSCTQDPGHSWHLYVRHPARVKCFYVVADRYGRNDL